MKTKLCPLLSAVALAACAHSVQAQPSLGISPASNQSILYWAATPTNYLLQSTTNLASPNWVIVNDTVPVVAATVSNSSPARFFRLFYSNPPAGMALIPAGWFTMGNSISDSDITDANPTNVYVSGFYMDTNLVSYSLWQTVYNAAITFYGYTFGTAGTGKSPNYPVQGVDSYDCMKWCNARSQLAGLTPVYYTDPGFNQLYKTGFVAAPYVNWGANGYRLPTEAEWEKAARGGLNNRRFPWGNLISEGQANYTGNTNYTYDFGPSGLNPIGVIGGTSPATSPPGSFDLNGYGLYDMAGNLVEWCWDLYAAPPYPAGSPYLGGVDPRGPVSGSFRVQRGGCSDLPATYARCANRLYNTPGEADYIVGFRCVKGL